MTKAQHEALIKFNQVSQQREICDVKEKRIKRFRKIALYFFLLSIILILFYVVALQGAAFSNINFDSVATAIPGREYLFFALGIISFVTLLISVFKFMGAKAEADKIRKIEGQLAQKAFSLMMMKTN